MESEKDSSKTEHIVKNSFWNMLTVLSSKLGGMIFVIILARFLLPDKFGIYNIALSVALFVITLTNVATNQTLSVYISNALGGENKEKANPYYRFIFKIKFLFSVLSAIILIALAYPLSLYLFNKPELTFPIIFFSIYIISFSTQNFYETLFYVINRVRFLTIKELSLQFLKIILCVAFFVLIYPSIFLSAVAIILSSLFAIILMRLNLKKSAKFLFDRKDKEIDKKRVFNFIKNAIVSSTSTTIFGYVDCFLLGIFVSAAYVGYYSSAFLIIGGFFGLLSISNVCLPIFTQINKENLSDAFGRIFRYLSIVSIPLIFGILILGNYVIKIVYGNEYLNATLPLLFLSILIFETPVTDNLKALLFSKEKPEFVSKIIVFGTILNITLNLILILLLMQISMLGAIAGAAIATVISRLTIMFSLSIMIKKELNISYNFKPLIKPIISSLIMAGIILLCTRK